MAHIIRARGRFSVAPPVQITRQQVMEACRVLGLDDESVMSIEMSAEGQCVKVEEMRDGRHVVWETPFTGPTRHARFSEEARQA